MGAAHSDDDIIILYVALYHSVNGIHTMVWWTALPFSQSERSMVGLEPAASGQVTQLSRADALTN